VRTPSGVILVRHTLGAAGRDMALLIPYGGEPDHNPSHVTLRDDGTLKEVVSHFGSHVGFGQYLFAYDIFRQEFDDLRAKIRLVVEQVASADPKHIRRAPSLESET
jgi:hypothetical protein